MGEGILHKAGEALGLNKANRSDAEGMIADWPNRPKLGATLMLDAYGAPNEATDEQLIWRDQGPYKRITATRAEHHHDFPKPHMDFLEHTVDYRVPPERAAALSEYDGSCTFDRTRGELSARCDLEGHNILTLNLAHDIVTGKINAEEARRMFGEIVGDDLKGKYPSYTTELQFTPDSASDTKFADTSTIPGSPERPDGLTEPRGDESDGEVLGFIGAADELEVISALAAGKKGMGSKAAEFAQMLHEEHGRHLEQTLQLGQQIGVTPLETKKVDAFRRKNAGELAELVALEGDEFERQFVEAKIKGHTELIATIDTMLEPAANSDAVKQHVRATRGEIARHLEQAKAIRPAMSW